MHGLAKEILLSLEEEIMIMNTTNTILNRSTRILLATLVLLTALLTSSPSPALADAPVETILAGVTTIPVH